MRKRVDPRVKTLVEHCVLLHQRAFLVIIGDRGAEQVVNLHYLLQQLCAASPLGTSTNGSSSSGGSSSGHDSGDKKRRCSVLWCYKKDLGFSSHRKKRNKQLKKKMQRGLYDPCRDDPFELFLSSTEIRYCYYKETHAILGSTYSMLVLQDFEALTPNILCRTIETVQGGGLVCLLLRSFSSLQQLYGLCMDFHARLRAAGAAAGAGAGASAVQAGQQQLLQQLHEVQPRFNERFFLSLTRCRNCLIVDDELNVLPLTSFASHLLPLHQHAVAAARAAARGADAGAAAAAAASAAYAAALEPAAAGSERVGKKGGTAGKDRESLMKRQQQILAENGKQRRQLMELRQQFRDIAPVGPLVDLCVTPDQAKAVLAFVDCLATASATSAAAAPAASAGGGDAAAVGAQAGAATREAEGGLRAAAAATAARRRSVGFETFALTAARGRGKSAALGLAVAAAIAYDYSNIFVCAPGAENVHTLFEFVIKGLNALGMKEHVDFSVKREDAAAAAAAAATAAHSSGMQSSSSNLEGGEQQLLPGRVAAAGGSGGGGGGGGGGGATGAQQLGRNRLIVGVEVQRRNALHKQTISFLPAAAAAATSYGRKEVAVLHNADLLVIDEAASIPIPVVKALFGPYVVLFSSTVNGYEGTGRALSLKLIQDLKQNRFALQQRKAAGCFRCLREITLLTPIRYAAGDGVEAWLHDLLCLDATQPAKLSQAALPPASRCSLYLVDRNALFSYHAAAEKFLHALLSLFVSSHYKNSPNDLLLLADAPAHLLFVLLPPIHDAATLPDIYCAIQVAIEGALSKQAIRQALGRGLRPSGDLLPWTLSQHFVDEDFGCLTGARIVRIACHPSLQRMGYGSAALQQLIEYFEEKKVALQDPLCNSPAAPARAVAAAADSEEEDEEEEQKGSEGDQAATAADTKAEEAPSLGEEDEGDGGTAAAATPRSRAEAGGTRGGCDLLNGESKAAGELTRTSTAAANNKPKGVLKKPETSETTSRVFVPSANKSAATGTDGPGADAEAAAAKAFVASLSRRSLRKTTTLPPLLLPCCSSPAAFRIHYFGVAFGLTAQLFRFWNRRHFIPVYLRHVPTDVTGEHSCIMLRPAISAVPHSLAAADAGLDGNARGPTQEGGEGLRGREDGSWVVPFAVDFRARLLQLLAGCFCSLPSSLSLCLISSAAATVWRKRRNSSSSTPSADTSAAVAAGVAQTSTRDNPAAVFPPVTLKNLHEFLSAHDVLRLRKYAQQLADLPLILDLLPTLAALYFNERLPAAIALSPLQQAVLLAVGSQRKTPDTVATEYNIPYNQTLALLNKTVHKFSSFFQRLQEEAVAAEVEQQWGRPVQRLAVEGGSGLLGELPSQSFLEELQESTRTVNKLQKEELHELINSFGKNAAGEFSMENFSNDDFKAALRGRCPGATPESSTVLSLKRKNFAKDHKALKNGSGNTAEAAGPKEDGDRRRKQLKRKRAKV